MADWKATVDGVGSFALAAMTVGSRGGGRAWVDLELEEEPELSGVRFGSRVTLTCRRGTCPVLEVCSFWRKDRHGRKVLRTVRPSGSRSPGSRAKLSGPHLLVRQRRLKEPVWPFIRRLGKELPLAEKNRASAGWLDRLEAVLPAGACFALEATMSPAARFTRAIESLGARTNLVTVLVRANPADEYWLADVYRAGDATQPGQRLATNCWTLPRWQFPEGRLHTEFSWAADSPSEIAWRFFAEPKRRSVNDESQPGYPIPTAPCTVFIDGRPWFASGVTTRIELESRINLEGAGDPDDRRDNIVTHLELLDSSVAGLDRWQPQTTTLMGEVAEEVHDSPYMVGIKPSGKVEDPLFRPLADWSIDDGVGPLWACQASPGFVRRAASAFYARWEPGDLVLFEVSDGGPAIIRGAPRRRLAAGALGAKGVSLAAGARGDDPGSVLEIEPDGTVHVVGTKVNMDRPVKKS